jgi:thiol-disulfide isomerase/thioredoxin
MKHVLCFLLLLALLVPALPARADSPATVKPLELITAINAAKGKVVLVNFWASWCEPCRLELPELIRLRAAYPEQDLFIMGVSMDENQSQYDNFRKKLGFNFPVSRGGDDVARMFGISAIPKLMLYDRKGALAVIREGMIPGNELRMLVDALLAK